MTSRRAESAQTPEPAPTPRPGSKGRPTRTRKEAEAARRRPLVVDDRKEARRRDRERATAQRAEEQAAMMSGDVKRMPLQHRGPERAFVRNLVDARRNVGEYFFPIAIVFMIVALVLPLFRPDLYLLVANGMLVVLWGGIAVCVLDSLVLRRRLRAALTERFGTVQRGLVGYGIMRAIQIRRFRLPRPVVKHGEQPT